MSQKTYRLASKILQFVCTHNYIFFYSNNHYDNTSNYNETIISTDGQRRRFRRRRRSEADFCSDRSTKIRAAKAFLARVDRNCGPRSRFRYHVTTYQRNICLLAERDNDDVSKPRARSYRPNPWRGNRRPSAICRFFEHTTAVMRELMRFNC